MSFRLKIRVDLPLVILLCFVVAQTSGHVALTYPPARGYDLDFLDNARTKGPCGMPKGKSIYNNIWVNYAL